MAKRKTLKVDTAFSRPGETAAPTPKPAPDFEDTPEPAEPVTGQGRASAAPKGGSHTQEMITVNVGREYKRELQMLKIDTGIKVPDLVREALDLLFEKHGVR